MNKPRLLIITSCSKSKKYAHPKEPNCQELLKETRENLVEKYSQYTCPAKDMYTGIQNKIITQAVHDLRQIFEVNYFIFSAGYGLLHEGEIITSYDCTFQGKSKDWIEQRVGQLKVREKLQEIMQTKFDVIYLALSKTYLNPIYDVVKRESTGVIVSFVPDNDKKILSLSANFKNAKALKKKGYSCHGVIGLKGDYLRIVTKQLLQESASKKTGKTELVSRFQQLLSQLARQEQ